MPNVFKVFVYITLCVVVAMAYCMDRWHNEDLKRQAQEQKFQQEQQFRQELLVTLEGARECYRHIGRFPMSHELVLLESYIPTGSAGFAGSEGFPDAYSASQISPNYQPINDSEHHYDRSIGQVCYQGLYSGGAVVTGTNSRGFTYTFSCFDKDLAALKSLMKK